MIADAEALDGGFQNPVLGSQSAFRALMDAMARPARLTRIDAAVVPPAGLNVASAAIACTLIDADTPYYVDDALESEVLQRWFAFHTGGCRAIAAADAIFALIGAPQVMPSFEEFAQGTQEYPDRSATLILQLESLEGGASLAFEGPGIKQQATIAPCGLPANFREQWRLNSMRFPRGVDLILTTGDMLVCLPRSARLIAAKD